MFHFVALLSSVLLSMCLSPWLSTLIHYSPYLTSKATVIVLLYTYTVYTWHSHSCVWFAQNRNTEAVLIFYIARKKSIAHKGQHQSRETHFWWDAIGSFEASVETNVYADILAKYYSITTLEFTHCTNPRFTLKISQGMQIIPQMVAEQNRPEDTYVLRMI